MLNSVIEMLSYAFLRRALIGGILLSICASLVGVSLVLRRNSLIGDGLSHVALFGVALATVLGLSPIEFSIPVVLLFSFLIIKTNDSKFGGDTIIAIIASSSLAVATFLVSINKGVNIDLNSYLFGSILALTSKDLFLLLLLTIIVIIFYLCAYNKIFAITFDSSFAKSIGINVNLYNFIFSTLCSLVIVLGMRLTGSLLISSLIIFPTLTSISIFKDFKSVIISSVIVSLISFMIGLYLSYILSVPTGSTIVIVSLILYLLALFYNNLLKLVYKK